MKRRKAQVRFHTLLAPHTINYDPTALQKFYENGFKKSPLHPSTTKALLFNVWQGLHKKKVNRANEAYLEFQTFLLEVK